MSDAVGLNGHAYYVHWGVIQISLANLIVIVVMILLFTAALLVKFPHKDEQPSRDAGVPDERN